MTEPVELLVAGLAAARLTRLVTTDVVSASVRDRIVREAYLARDGRADHTADGLWADLAQLDGEAAPKLATLITCRWCVSVWVAVAVVVARRTRIGRTIVEIAAVAQLAGAVNG